MVFPLRRQVRDKKGAKKMTQFLSPLCPHCKRAYKLGEGKPVCEAFPNGVPDGILYRAGDHTKPWEGDDGLQFVDNPEYPIPPWKLEMIKQTRR